MHYLEEISQTAAWSDIWDRKQNHFQVKDLKYKKITENLWTATYLQKKKRGNFAADEINAWWLHLIGLKFQSKK